MPPTVSATNGVTSQTFPLHQEEKDIYCQKLCHVSQSQGLTEEHNNSRHYCFSLIRSIKRTRQRQPSIADSILRRVPSSGPLNECALAFSSPPPRVPYTAADAINLFSQLHDFPGVAFLKSFYCSRLPLNSILQERLCNGRQDGKSRGTNPAVCNSPI
jgi:hypothetical protein